jgi:hypothetical protein
MGKCYSRDMAPTLRTMCSIACSPTLQFNVGNRDISAIFQAAAFAEVTRPTPGTRLAEPRLSSDRQALQK